MMTNQRMKAFLLLGVMLLGLAICGCAPEQPTEPSETAPGLNTVAFHERVNTKNIESISITALYWSYSIRINKENEIDSFLESFLKEAQFTDDAEVVGTMHYKYHIYASGRKTFCLVRQSRGLHQSLSR